MRTSVAYAHALAPDDAAADDDARAVLAALVASGAGGGGAADDDDRERFVVADGLDGLARVDGPYDAVVVDCMVQGEVPPGCRAPAFVDRIAALLRAPGDGAPGAPGGKLVQWLWPSSRQQVEANYRQNPLLGAPVFKPVNPNAARGAGTIYADREHR